MTCDPTIATCFNAATMNFASSALSPTGVCGPGELGPVCYTAPADQFGMCMTPRQTNAAGLGLTSLFAPRSLSSMTSTALPPANVDLRLSDYRTQLPTEVMSSIEPLLRLEADFNIPISFRIVNIRLSTGETVPQMMFFRTGDTPSVPSVGGGGPGGAGTPGVGAPRPPTSVGLTVSLAGTSLAVVAFDRLLLQSLVDHHLMPAEARLPVMFASTMTAHLILNRMGLVSSTPVQGLRTAPTFLGFQILAQLLLERLGVNMNSFTGQAGAMTLGAMPFFLARQSPALARALAGAGEIPTLAALGEMGAGAATLRIGAIFARALGYVALVDLGARAGVWAIGRINAAVSSGNYDNNVRMWNLIRTSQDIYNQERFGSVLSGAFGMIWTFFDSVDAMVSSESDARYTANLERIQDTLITGSDQFGDAMHQNIMAIIARNTAMSADGTGTVNWDAVARDVRAFYQSDDNASNIRRGYSLVDDATAPRTSSGISSLISIVNDRGEILNQTEFREHFERHARIHRIDAARALETRAIALGLMEDVNGVRISRIPTDPAQRDSFMAGLNPAQLAFIQGEGARLTTEMIQMSALENAIGH